MRIINRYSRNFAIKKTTRKMKIQNYLINASTGQNLFRKPYIDGRSKISDEKVVHKQ